jgi:hypothetical protein
VRGDKIAANDGSSAKAEKRGHNVECAD